MIWIRARCQALASIRVVIDLNTEVVAGEQVIEIGPVETAKPLCVTQPDKIRIA